jgi:hypothetical protein
MSAQSQSRTAEDGGNNEESFGKRAAEMGSEAKNAAQERVAAGANAGMERAAEGLDSAAEKMRSRAQEDEGVRATLEGKAADAMDRTATYLKDHDSEQLMHDIEEFVRNHPLQAAAGALVAGYVLGKIVR